jgi:putative transcriptional regulator
VHKNESSTSPDETQGHDRGGTKHPAGAREALAFAQGARDGYGVHVPAVIDVKAIREKVHMSQDEFARQYGFSKSSLQQWEQGRRTPTGASRAFLVVVARDPDAAHRALSR